MRRVFTTLILLIAAGSAFYVFTGNSGMNAAPKEDTALDTVPSSRLIVYYFDMGKDCSTCLNLETYTRDVLDTYFADKLASGEIRWEMADVDRPENVHFVEEFGLYTKSVVLATVEDGEILAYNNLSRIWELVYDKEAYSSYVRTQIDEALGAQS